MSKNNSKTTEGASNRRKLLSVPWCSIWEFLAFAHRSTLQLYITCDQITLASGDIVFVWTGLYAPCVFIKVPRLQILTFCRHRTTYWRRITCCIRSTYCWFLSDCPCLVWPRLEYDWTHGYLGLGNLHLFYRQDPKNHRRCVSLCKERIILTVFRRLQQVELSLNTVFRVWALLPPWRLYELLLDKLAPPRCDLVIDRSRLGNHYLSSLMFLYFRHHCYSYTLSEPVDRWLLDQYNQLEGES